MSSPHPSVPFSVDRFENSELVSLLVESAAEQSYPTSKTLFLYGMVNKEFERASRKEVNKKLDSWQKVYSSAFQESLKLCKDLKLTAQRGASGFMYESLRNEMEKLVPIDAILKTETFTRIYRQNAETFVMERKHLAAMVFGVCMSCMSPLCPQQRRYPEWCSVGGVHLYASSDCIFRRCVRVGPDEKNRLHWDDVSDVDFENNAHIARCMLSQGGHHSVAEVANHPVANEDSWLPGRLLRPSMIFSYNERAKTFHSLVFMWKHPYIPSSYTLEGRLLLSKQQVEIAITESHQVSHMPRREALAVHLERLDKFRKDVGIRLQATLNPGGRDFLLGPTEETRRKRLQVQLDAVWQLSKAGLLYGEEGAVQAAEKEIRAASWNSQSVIERRFRCLGPTIERLIVLHDPAIRKTSQKYVSAMGIREVAVAVERVVWAYDHLELMDKRITNSSKTASNAAYEWCTQLVSGCMEGPTGPWRIELDTPKNHDFPFCKNRPELEYIVAAMHTFDKLDQPSWTLSCSVKYRYEVNKDVPCVYWHIKNHSVEFFEISGQIHPQYMGVHEKRNMHNMMVAAFKFNKIVPDDPRKLDFPWGGPHYDIGYFMDTKTLDTANEALLEYYNGIASLANAFPKVRFACLAVLGLKPEIISRELVNLNKRLSSPGYQHQAIKRSAFEFACWAIRL